MKRTIISLILTVIFLFAAVPVAADGTAYETFSATQCLYSFFTTKTIKRLDDTTWDSTVVVDIQSFSYNGSATISLYNKDYDYMGYVTDEITDADVYYATLTHNYKNIRLYVYNNNQGINLQISGRWIGNYY